ncbi:NAD(P)-binding domain-containing protein [Chitinophaga sedimenti]|uniref:NADPH-dependent F420 reductase n=1 Tax=Chitinophaga sedimenti TaxID=2033606 RepID=UPI0020066451|nr:NAD(P)-binding domain-containing protein [Chitinophaga sedimenti]MCK7555096.1 NAD(P)-binding domain-containing protein [Chitinophaga sedimenti]
MKVGILGSGVVGRTLAGGLSRIGNHVMIGTRDIQKEELQAWREQDKEKHKLGSFKEASIFGELIVLCTQWTGTKNVIEQAGIWNFKNKVIVDVTNPLDGKGPDENGRVHFAALNSASAGEQVQAWLPDSHVVKALNCVGNIHMVAPKLEEGAPTMFIAGNDDLAKKAVTEILSKLGWQDVADMGGIEISRDIEALCVLWYAYGFRTGSWTHAFKLLKK